MMTLVYLAIWVLLCVMIGHRAAYRGRNGAGWMFFALACSPLIAGICLFLLPEAEPSQDKSVQHPGWKALRAGVAETTTSLAEDAERSAHLRRMYGRRR